jgi:hypothetical protein
VHVGRSGIRRPPLNSTRYVGAVVGSEVVRLSLILTPAARDARGELEQLLGEHGLRVTGRGRATLSCRTELSNFEALFEAVGQGVVPADQRTDSVGSESSVAVPPFLSEYVSSVAVEPKPVLMHNEEGEQRHRGDAC